MSKKVKHNRSIDALFIAGTDLAIDYDFGFALACKYAQDLQLLTNKQVKFKDLGYGKLRAAQMTSIYLASSGNVVPMISDFSNEQAVGHFKLSGMMRSNDGLSSRGVSSLAEDIRALAADDRIIGGVLEVSSGGGEALSVPILASAIKDFTTTGKPFYTWSHMAGSAAYWGTINSTAHYTSGTSAQVGSIGAFIRINTPMLQYFKENTMEFYAPESSDKNAAIRALMGGDPSKMYQVASKMAQQFQLGVDGGRALNAELKESTLAGGMFFSEDAENRGLTDGVRTFNEIISDIAAGKSHISNSQNSDNMTLKEFTGAIAGHARRLFGVELADDATPEVIATALEGIKPVAEQITEALATINGLVSTNQEALNAATARITELEATAAAVDTSSLQARIDALEASNVTLIENNTNLSAEVLKLQGKKPEVQTDSPYTGPAKAFMDQLGNVTVDGDSKMAASKK